MSHQIVLTVSVYKLFFVRMSLDIVLTVCILIVACENVTEYCTNRTNSNCCLEELPFSIILTVCIYLWFFVRYSLDIVLNVQTFIIVCDIFPGYYTNNNLYLLDTYSCL